MAILEHKIVPPVLQAKTTASGDNACAKPHVIGVYKAAGVAVAINHTKVHRVLTPLGWWRGGGLVWMWDAWCWRAGLQCDVGGVTIKNKKSVRKR